MGSVWTQLALRKARWCHMSAMVVLKLEAQKPSHLPRVPIVRGLILSHGKSFKTWFELWDMVHFYEAIS